MSFVYVVIENSDSEPVGGGVFDTAFRTFGEAKAAVFAKYKDILDAEKKFAEENELDMISNTNATESLTRYTLIYIEKGINIYIHKLPIKMSGGRRSRRSRRK